MVRARRSLNTIGEPACGRGYDPMPLIICSGVVLLLLIARSHAVAQSFTDNAPLTTFLFGRSIVPTIQLTLPVSLTGHITYTDPVTTTVLRLPGEFRWWQTWDGHPFAFRLGLGFAGGETRDVTRLMLDQPAARNFAPNEVQVGVWIPF
jgi:hypothetical protein